MEFEPANQYSLRQLTQAYNQTRSDYIVPMPMCVGRLREYIRLYDVDLSASWIANDRDRIMGLGMLGIRARRGWITRLGVLPEARREGIGGDLIRRLVETADERGIATLWLEVIKGNVPAIDLFEASGFAKTRELRVARRAADGKGDASEITVKLLEAEKVTVGDKVSALTLLSLRNDRLNWLLETESMRNAENLQVLQARFKDGSAGWVSYHRSTDVLSQIVVEVIKGAPSRVTYSLLALLHRSYRNLDAVVENIDVSDPRWPGFRAAGYLNTFDRIEMVRRRQSC